MDDRWPDPAESLLWKAVQSWRDDAEPWLEAAYPRLPETVRVNPLRPDQTWTEARLTEMGGEPIPWLPEGGGGAGWRLPWPKGRCEDERAKLLLRALHATGRVTQQEAVSMIPVKLLDCRPGMHVLDMCAAPGSKATQLAEAIADEGVVLANESNPGRGNMLVSNAQRAGVTSLVTTQHDGRGLPRPPLPGFDRVLVDTPCTGNATTRKNPELWANWTPSSGPSLQTLQIALLRKGAMLLAPGGLLAYSTCSLDPVENEAVVAEILDGCEFLRLIEPDLSAHLPGLVSRPGMVEWPALESSIESGILEQLPRCLRVWNDENDSGGFFVALFEHVGESECAEALATADEMARMPLGNPPDHGRNTQAPASAETLEQVGSEWGEAAAVGPLFERGKRLNISSSASHDWLWSEERSLRRGRRLPGGHWHPFHVTQVGLPAWEMRKGRVQRPLSKAMHIIGPRIGQHVHSVPPDMLADMLLRGGPDLEAATELIPTLAGERGGSLLLTLEAEGQTWWVPAWLGARLTLMLPDAERNLLGWLLGVEMES